MRRLSHGNHHPEHVNPNTRAGTGPTPAPLTQDGPRLGRNDRRGHRHGGTCRRHPGHEHPRPARPRRRPPRRRPRRQPTGMPLDNRGQRTGLPRARHRRPTDPRVHPDLRELRRPPDGTPRLAEPRPGSEATKWRRLRPGQPVGGRQRNRREVPVRTQPAVRPRRAVNLTRGLHPGPTRLTAGSTPSAIPSAGRRHCWGHRACRQSVRRCSAGPPLWPMPLLSSLCRCCQTSVGARTLAARPPL